jgi:glycosyltransferase involved in cell wall biosynthesis
MAKKIKIVYLIDTFYIGGAERLLLDICKNIDKTKFEVYVAAVVCGGSLEQEFRQLDIDVKVFNKKSKLGFGLIKQLRAYLKEIQPQIVHTHLFGADTWGRLAAIFSRVPIIISTEHNINLNENWLKKFLKFVLARFTTKIIAVSQGVKDYSVKIEKIKPQKITVIYNGIDLAKFTYRGYQPLKPQKSIKAVVMARLEKQKGHQYLIKALPLIIKQYPNFKLYIIGTGSLENKLKKQVKQLNLQDNVVFKGKILQPEKILQQMDLFILPSVWEGLGIAILEAQAVGLPVLASNIPGPDELIEANKTGLLFEPKNSGAISKKVKELLAQPELAEQMVKQAREQVESKFSLKQMVNNYTDLYLNLRKND